MREFHALRDQRGLQHHAHMMLSGFDGDGEIGIAVVRSYPCSVHSELHGWISYSDVGAGILKEVNQRLSRVRLRQGVWGLVLLHLEADVSVAAGCGRSYREIPGKGGYCKKQRDESDFHDFLSEERSIRAERPAISFEFP